MPSTIASGNSSLCSSSVAYGRISLSTKSLTVARISFWMSVRPAVCARRAMSSLGLRRGARTSRCAVMPAARPLAAITRAILREASSIISSPSIAEPFVAAGLGRVVLVGVEDQLGVVVVVLRRARRPRWRCRSGPGAAPTCRRSRARPSATATRRKPSASRICRYGPSMACLLLARAAIRIDIRMWW